MTLLSWLGVGRAPMGLLLVVLLMTWGIIGFMANNVLRPVMPAEWMVALVSLPLAALGSAGVMRGMVTVLVKVLPVGQTSAQKRRELCGCVGEAIFDITPEFGMAMVRDGHGNRFQVPCRAASGSDTIAKGEQVLLIRYDHDANVFDVICDELGRSADSASKRANTPPARI